jgi:hypothetical protein
VAGTSAVIEVAPHVSVVAAPLNNTVPGVVPKLPLMVNDEPPAPLKGEMLVMVGAPQEIVNEALELPVPAGVVTEMTPVAAEDGTVAVICVELFTVKLVAAVPPNFTAVAPVKLAPVIDTLVPEQPLVGEKLDTVGPEPPALEPFKATITIAQ